MLANSLVSKLAFPILFAIALTLSSCEKEDSPKNKTLNIGKDANPVIVAALPIQNRSFDIGTAGYVPAGYPQSSQTQWQDFFDQGAALYGGLFGVHVSAYETKKPADSLILEQLDMAENDVQKVIPYFLISANHKVDIPFTAALGEEMVAVARANAEKFKPVYFGVGNEINSFYWNEPHDYELYKQYIIQAVHAIKEVSPKTITFTNFQFDMLRGKSDLTGISHPPHWELLDAFKGHVDAFAFTAYPFLQYQKQSDIPENYLHEIRAYTDLPVIITETGWPTINTVALVEGSAQSQIDFLVQITKQAHEINTMALIWVLPHDGNFGDGGGVFDNISLFDSQGNPKPAYEYWKAVHALPKP